MARRFLALGPVLPACLALVALVPSALAGGTSGSATLDVGVLTQINAIRAQHNLAPLVLNPSLSDAAETHTMDMVDKGYFAHDSSNGTAFWKRIVTFYPRSGFHYWSVGENIFWARGSATATRGIEAWMASPPHRANILDADWRQVGIGSVTTTAPGTFGGRTVTVITADFGVRH
jgi:uncharacterized protein YkwD